MYLVLGLFMVTVVIAFVTNVDLMSPAKLFLLTFASFHVGGLISSEDSSELWLLVLLVLLVGVVIVFLEATVAKPSRRKLRSQKVASFIRRMDVADSRFFAGIWLLSVPAVLAQGFMIQYFGGLEGYFNVLGLRVLEWRGLGWAKSLIMTLLPLNLAYFAAGLMKPRSRSWWLLYGLHFSCLLVVSLMLGSRSSILNTFALQLFCFNYIKRRVSLHYVATLAAILLFAALILGVVRDGFKIDDGRLVTGLDVAESSINIVTLNYGITPLKLLVDTNLLELAHGSTFLSLLTNVIPRDWWPDKPDTGGVYFTKVYTGDAWDGASNLTPTFLGEWVMNFGWTIGLLMFLISYSVIFYWVTWSYRRIVQRLDYDISYTAAIDFLIYLTAMWAAVALMVGEVTNVILTTLLSQTLPLLCLRSLLTRRNAVASSRSLRSGSQPGK